MAESTIGLLRVVLSSNTAQFESGLDRATSSLNQFDRGVKDVGKNLEQVTSTAPKGIGDIADQAKRAEQATTLFSRAARALVAVFSVRAIVGFASDVLELTGKLTDLAGKTGITTDGLQVLQFALGQSGITIDQAATAAVRMSRALVEGDKGVVQAVKALNLNIEDLIASGPEQAFLAIGEAIAKVPDPMQRAALAIEIFGRSGADLLPGFTSNMQALGEEARKSGAIIGSDLVAAGDRAGDSLTRLKGVGMALLAQVFLPMAPGIEAVANWLAGALTTGLNTARNAVNGLLLKGLQLDLWLAETAASITKTVAEVPVLGRVFGQTSGDVSYFSQQAQHAKDTLAAFVAQGNEPAKASMASATPVARNYATAVGGVERAARRATQAIQQGAAPQQASNLLVSRSLQDTARLTQQLEQWARVNGAVLAPSIQQVSAELQEQIPLVNTMQHQWAQFPGTVRQNTAQAGSGITGFFSKVFGGAQGLSSSVTSIFQQAFTGGGGALGAVQSFATQGLSKMLAMIPGVGQWASAFAGPIVAMLSKLTKRFGDFFRNIFGGPSASEVEGRGHVAEFEESLHGALNAQQELESQGEDWRRTVIAIRDAYLAAGRTEEEALRDAERLWESSRQGAEESLRVIEEIKRKMQQLTDESHTIQVDVEYRTSAPPGARPPGEPENTYQDPGFASGTMGRFGRWFQDFGNRFPTNLHGNEAVVTRMQAPSFARDVLGASGASVSNNYFMVAIPTEAAGDPQRMAAEVFRQVPSGLEVDKGGMTTAFEQLIHNVIGTYYPSRG